jgi:hypothetical protein
VFLNELEVVDRGLGIAPFEPESRHVRMNGAQAALQSFAEIIVVKLVIAKRSKRRCIKVRALARRAHGVTPSALDLEQGFSALLLAVEAMLASLQLHSINAMRQDFFMICLSDA